jgi:hypothetical protein
MIISKHECPSCFNVIFNVISIVGIEGPINCACGRKENFNLISKHEVKIINEVK